MLVVPVLLLLISLLVQFGVWYHAQHVAHAAAEEGARVARLETGTAAAGERRALDFLDRLGPSIVRDRTVTAHRDDTDVVVEITGTAATVVPGFGPPVRAVATSPVERFEAP